MKLVAIFPFLFIGSSFGLDFNARKCLACENLSNLINERIKKHSVNRKINIGGILGPDGERINHKVIDYIGSEFQYNDVIEGVCDAARKSKDCYTVLNDFEANINDWFFGDERNKNGKSIFDNICKESISNCNNEQLKKYFEEDLKEQMENSVKKMKEMSKGKEGEKIENQDEKEQKGEQEIKNEKEKNQESRLTEIIREMKIKFNLIKSATLNYWEKFEILLADHVVALRNYQDYKNNWKFLIIPSFLIIFIIGLFLNLILIESGKEEKKKKTSLKYNTTASLKKSPKNFD